ncbi:MAG: glycine cleavage system protein GcvH [Desulfovibrionaceae bacterium]|nr:glycine cleavage system protein GcvH [Desulfovibrionaceae bacterium]
MKTVEELQLPSDRKYTKEHVWIKMEGDTALVGISDYAQDQLGEVAFVDVPELHHMDAHAEFGSVESVKSVNALYMPVAGEILASNTELESTPTLINVSCYSEGWIIKIKPDDPSAIDALLDAQQYQSGL